MKRSLIVLAAGIPKEFGNEFVSKIRNQVDISIISWLPLPYHHSYSDHYATDLYNKFAEKLKSMGGPNPSNSLAKANLLLLYVDKENGNEKELIEKFDTETLMLPLATPRTDLSMQPRTTNQRRRIVNNLVKAAERAIKRGMDIGSMISEEVNNRDNKTCLLLPRRNFGNQIEDVFDFIRSITSSNALRKKDMSSIGEEFRKHLQRVSASIPTVKEDGRTYFKGRKNLVFKSPGKARGRHGLAPGWNDLHHEASCVIRSRMRFGSPYDPRFHYDCKLSPRISRRFPSCHGEKTVPSGRSHVNIAPNDNVR